MQSNNKKPVVVGIGELLWDMLPTGKKAGGAPINFVYHASRLGAEGYASAPWETMGWGAKSSKNWIIIRSGI